MSVRSYPYGTEYPPKALDPTLQALSDLNTSANTAPYFTDIDQAALMTVTPFARSILDDADAASLKATLEFGSGVANRVALWADTDTLTSDPELYYDPTTNRLGIGTSTPDATLAVVSDTDVGLAGNYFGTNFTSTWRFTAANAVFVRGLRVVTSLNQNGLNLSTYGGRTDALTVNPTVTGASGTAHVVVGAYVTGGNTGAGQVNDWTGVRIENLFNSGGGTIVGLRGFVMTDPPVTGITTVTAFYGGVVAGTGRYNLFMNGTAQNYLAGSLGIGVTTPTAPLTFANVLGPKIDIWSSLPTNGRYGIGLQNGQMQIYADPSGRISLGNTDNAGTAFAARFDVYPTYTYSSVAMGVAWGLVANYELTTNRFYAAGVSRFESNLVVAGILDAYSYSMIHQLRVGDHVAPGFTLDVNGQSIFRNIVGINYAPDPSYWLRCGGAKFDGIDVVGAVSAKGITALTDGIVNHGTQLNAGALRVGSLVWPDHALHVTGNAYVSGVLGVYFAPAAGYNITTGAILCNYIVTNSGTSTIQDLTVPGATTLTGLTVNGQPRFNGLVGIYYAADPGYWLRCPNAYFDSVYVGGTVNMNDINVRAGGSITGPLGVGWPAEAGYELTTNRLRTVGTSYMSGTVGIGRGASPAWSLCVGNMYADGEVQPDSLYVRGIARIASGAQPGYYFSAYNIFSATNVYAVTDVNANSIVSRGMLYTSGVYGITAQSFADGGTYGVVQWLYGNPNWVQIRAELVHSYGSAVYLNITASGYNYYQFHIASGNAYIGQGAWIDAPSDRRIKRGITPIDAPLARLAKLHGSHYERTDRKHAEGFPAPNPHEYGLIAQDVAEALPDAAFEHDYGEERGKLWNYYDRPVLALLVESVNALRARLETLEQKG